MSKKYSLWLTAFMSASLLLSACNSKERAVSNGLAEFQAAQLAGDLPGQERALLSIVMADEEHAEAWAMLGQVQMRQGKFGAAFTSTSTPHGANEMTLITMFIPMYHHGMIVVTPGYGDPAVLEAGSPYGATSVSGSMSDKLPTEKDLQVARFQGRRVAEVAKALSTSRA